MIEIRIKPHTYILSLLGSVKNEVKVRERRCSQNFSTLVYHYRLLLNLDVLCFVTRITVYKVCNKYRNLCTSFIRDANKGKLSTLSIMYLYILLNGFWW